MGVSTKEDPWYIVTEFADFGDLKHMLNNCKKVGMPLTVIEQLRICSHVAMGMGYLQTKKVRFLPKEKKRERKRKMKKMKKIKRQELFMGGFYVFVALLSSPFSAHPPFSLFTETWLPATSCLAARGRPRLATLACPACWPSSQIK